MNFLFVKNINTVDVVKFLLPEFIKKIYLIKYFKDHKFLLWVNDFKLNQEIYNGIIMNAKGTPVRLINFGKGVNNLVVDLYDRIWFIYGDEGIFDDNSDNKLNNFSENGVICFDKEGQLIFKDFADLALAGQIPLINDCYAINYDQSSTIWICYYSDLGQSLVRINANFSLSYLGEIEGVIPDALCITSQKIWKISKDGMIDSTDRLDKKIVHYAAADRDQQKIEAELVIARANILVFQNENGDIFMNSLKS